MSVEILKSDFLLIKDRSQAWDDLLGLTKDENNIVRFKATEALGSLFAYASDKEQAWQEVLRLTKDESYIVRVKATESLGTPIYLCIR